MRCAVGWRRWRRRQRAAPLAGGCRRSPSCVLLLRCCCGCCCCCCCRAAGFASGASGDSWRLPAFAVGQPDVVDRMLDRVQARARGEHPAGEDALDLALQRDLVDLDEGVGVRRLGRRPRVADARRHLQRAELHRLVDRHVEGDDAAGDLVEAGEHRASDW